MGADLYIRSLTDAARAKYEGAFDEACKARNEAPLDSAERQALQSEVSRLYELMYPDEGYFRDSYNGTNVLWTLGLSWWNDVNPDDEGHLAGENLKRFRQQVAEAKMIDIDEAYLEKNHCTVDEQNTVEDWRKFFEEKRKRLVAFLDGAIALGEPVVASL